MINSSSQKWLGFYFHIPFCPHICPYCDFIKTSRFSKKDITIFFSKLEEQLHYFLNILKERNSDFCQGDTHATIYFGGGTPGLFSSEYYGDLIATIKQNFILKEVTLETNPFSNRIKNFEGYRKVGFDRVTLGAQSLCEKTLKHLGRKHTPSQILENIQELKQSGFENIQVDLIYGLQKEIRTTKIEDEIQLLADAGASGISTYALSIENRTEFAKFTHFADEENAVQEYASILNKCQEIGFEQIETSNFSKFEARHNHIYWHGHPYIGIGTGAHGLMPPTEENPYGIRYKVGNPQKTLGKANDFLVYEDPDECKKNFMLHYEKSRSKEEYTEEMIFTLLRTKKGIPLDWISGVFYTLLENPKIKRAIVEQKIVCDGRFIALSAAEKIRGDAWALDFISILSHHKESSYNDDNGFCPSTCSL
jgi:oxygen-independent coproporphyrinogen-3 oxidase